MAAFTGPKLRCIKGEKNCGVMFVFQVIWEASVNRQMQQHYTPFYEGIRYIALFYQSTKFEECSELK